MCGENCRRASPVCRWRYSLLQVRGMQAALLPKSLPGLAAARSTARYVVQVSRRYKTIQCDVSCRHEPEAALGCTRSRAAYQVADTHPYCPSTRPANTGVRFYSKFVSDCYWMYFWPCSAAIGPSLRGCAKGITSISATNPCKFSDISCNAMSQQFYWQTGATQLPKQSPRLPSFLRQHKVEQGLISSEYNKSIEKKCWFIKLK